MSDLESATSAAQDGAAFLDDHPEVPANWRELIDRDELDMSELGKDLLSQLGRKVFELGSLYIFRDVRLFLGLSQQQTADLGFTYWIEPCGFPGCNHTTSECRKGEWQGEVFLTKAWKALLSAPGLDD